MKLHTGEGGRDKNAMALKEMKSNEEPLPRAEQVNVELLRDTCPLPRPLF